MILAIRDFDATPVLDRPADSSAGTIASTGFLLLSQIETSHRNSTGAKYWSEAAVKVTPSF